MTPAPTARYLLSWRPTSVLVIIGIWTLLVVLSIANGKIGSEITGRPFDPGHYSINRAYDWYTCAVFTPLYIWMARRWPIERTTWRTRVPAWLVVTALIVPAKFVLQDSLTRLTFPGMSRPPLGRLIAIAFVPEMIAFWAMAATILSIEYYDRWRHREVQAHLLGRQLAEARLDALSAQLRPHFLFNTLQGISTLLHRDPQAADQMLTRLGELLRKSLKRGESQEVTLGEELATLDHYVSIQHIRFQDRLVVNVDADGASDALVPHFILQPLLENAIEHGIARRSGTGTIHVRAHIDTARLRVEVVDDGGTNGSEPRAQGGVGLANTRARLEALYGTDATMDAAPRTPNGFAVTISLPIKRAPSAP